MLSWLQRRANAGTLAVGFCELNGWQEMHSTTDLMKNRQKIVLRAANAGFAHSHVMATGAVQPFNLGIVAARPFEVLGEYGPSHGFQRGVLHVYFSAPLDLHIFVVHLHAHR
jgi:hypothetical protein